MPPRRNLRRAVAAATALSVTVFGLVLSTPAMAAECDSTIDVFTASPADTITVTTSGSAETVIDVAVTDCVETHPTITVDAVDQSTGSGDRVTMAPTATPGAYQGAITWSDDKAGAYKLALTVFGHNADGSISPLTTSRDYTVVVDPPEVTPPSAPRSVKVSKPTRTSGKVSWKVPSTTGGAKITGYRVIEPGKDVTVKAKARSYTVKKLKAGRTYTIKIKARNAKGYGPAAAVTFKTKPPAPPKPKHYRNCASLRNVYPHGVGRSGAVDSTSGDPVLTFYRSTKVYKMNDEPRNKKTGEYDLDRDNDGIACEKK